MTALSERARRPGPTPASGRSFLAPSPTYSVAELRRYMGEPVRRDHIRQDVYAADVAYQVTPGDVILIARGFVTDWASMPRLLWWLWPPEGRWAPAAGFHDLGYTMQDRTRREVDRIFLDGMRLLGCSRLNQLAGYWAVRLFGRRSWRRLARLKVEHGGIGHRMALELLDAVEAEQVVDTHIARR